MRAKPVYGTIGSISTGTLLPSDLFDAFLYECKQLHLTREERNKVRAIAAGTIETDSDTSEEERMVYDVEDLQTILENHAAPYMYFGTLDGDGADFGFWLSHDSLNDFEGLKVSDTSEVPSGYSGEVLHVNDHGNCTLYNSTRGRLREVWSVV